jgi:glutaconate CoA-transferase subunit A
MGTLRMAQWITPAEAAALVPDGCTLALGGMTLYRRPVAFVRWLLGRPVLPRHLTLLAFTAGYESDLLIGAGCVSAIRTCYAGLEAFGFAPMFTATAQAGTLRVIEETEASLAFGIRAGLAGVGFMPGRGWLGTDLPRLRPDVKTVIDPYSGEVLMAFPAIHCDVAVVHALEADGDGNIALNHNTGVDEDLVYLADRLIVTVERRVEKVERTLDRLVMPGIGVDYLVLAPQGAAPTSCYPLYPISGRELVAYVEACAAGQFNDYLQAWLKQD